MDPTQAAADAPGLPPDDRRRAFRVLFVSLLCVGMGHSVLFSILPALARELGIAEVAVGAIFTASAALWVVCSPIWGRLSDRWGRRPIILAGLIGYAASTVALGVSIDLALAAAIPVTVAYPLMMGSRALFGLVGSGIFPATQAYIADRTSSAERLPEIARIGGAVGLGTALGPGLGAVLVAFGLLAPVYVIAAIAAASALMIWRLLPERREPSHSTPARRLGFADPRLRTPVAIAFTLSTVQAILFQTIGFLVIDRFALGPADGARYAGAALTAAAVAALFAQLVLVPWLRPRVRTLLFAGASLGAAGAAMLAVASNIALIAAGMALAGLGLGLVRPANLTAASLAVAPDEQGAAAGLVGAMAASGYIVAPLLGTGLYQLEPHGPYLLSAALMGLILALGTKLRPGADESPRPDQRPTKRGSRFSRNARRPST